MVTAYGIKSLRCADCPANAAAASFDVTLETVFRQPLCALRWDPPGGTGPDHV